LGFQGAFFVGVPQNNLDFGLIASLHLGKVTGMNVNIGVRCV